MRGVSSRSSTGREPQRSAMPRFLAIRLLDRSPSWAGLAQRTSRSPSPGTYHHGEQPAFSTVAPRGPDAARAKRYRGPTIKGGSPIRTGRLRPAASILQMPARGAGQCTEEESPPSWRARRILPSFAAPEGFGVYCLASVRRPISIPFAIPIPRGSCANADCCRRLSFECFQFRPWPSPIVIPKRTHAMQNGLRFFARMC